MLFKVNSWSYPQFDRLFLEVRRCPSPGTVNRKLQELVISHGMNARDRGLPQVRGWLPGVCTLGGHHSVGVAGMGREA